MYDALEIAKYIIDRCYRMGEPVTNLRLQKLLYFIQIESYKIDDAPMFSNDIVAWQFGPVVTEVYYEYNMFGGSPILLTYDNIDIDSRDLFLIDNVIDEYDVPVWELVNLTHERGGPWDITVKKKGLRSTISDNLLRSEANKI